MYLYLLAGQKSTFFALLKMHKKSLKINNKIGSLLFLQMAGSTQRGAMLGEYKQKVTNSARTHTHTHTARCGACMLGVNQMQMC